MDKAGFSGKPPKTSPYSFEDIPEAVREATKTKPRSRRRLVLILAGLLGVGAIALGSVWYLTMKSQQPVNSIPSVATSPSPVVTQPTATASPTQPDADHLLGHFAYTEAPQTELQPLSPNGQIKLRRAAAQQFLAMTAAARAEGVNLVPISGFRSASEQEQIFFTLKAQRGQVATKRAEVSAPPGYSEHHTGYAVDIGDGNAPATSLNPTFENTKAFKWLSTNAARFGFELSFGRDNPQGVSYEPWHWRYVGDRHSLETFYKARGNKSAATEPIPPE